MDPTEILPRITDDECEEFSLNSGQRNVVLAFVEGILGHRRPVTLCHGVFGSWKSFLVCVIIIILYRVKNAGGFPDDFKVAVSSMTNVAVDRILLGLLKMNFVNLVRVGSLKKIAKGLLPFSAQQLKNKSEDLKELHAILNDEKLLPTERRAVQDTIRLFACVTCIAASFECLDHTIAHVMILDESSQVTEPLSMLLLSRLSSSYALLVGDPKQLPPSITTNCEDPDVSLERTLFSRLVDQGVPSILLDTQYRCHPRIAKASSDLFYDGVLSTGQRCDHRPVVDGASPLCAYKSNGHGCCDGRCDGRCDGGGTPSATAACPRSQLVTHEPQLTVAEAVAAAVAAAYSASELPPELPPAPFCQLRPKQCARALTAGAVHDDTKSNEHAPPPPPVLQPPKQRQPPPEHRDDEDAVPLPLPREHFNVVQHLDPIDLMELRRVSKSVRSAVDQAVDSVGFATRYLRRWILESTGEQSWDAVSRLWMSSKKLDFIWR
ncbi:hypothetical protein HK405_013041, partial [Cladochytrium tenue]